MESVKSENKKKGEMLTKEQVKEKLGEKGIVTYNDFDASLTNRLMGSFSNKKPKMEFLLWTFPNGAETAFHKAEIPIDQQEYDYGGKKYIIDRNKIQNRLGVPTYNHTVNDATGGLSYIKKSELQIEVDAKNYAEGVRRNWFTALWGQWKIPFLVMVISMVVALALAFMAMYFATQWKEVGGKLEVANACLNDLSNTCLNNQIQANVIKAQKLAEEQARKEAESKK